MVKKSLVFLFFCDRKIVYLTIWQKYCHKTPSLSRGTIFVFYIVSLTKRQLNELRI